MLRVGVCIAILVAAYYFLIALRRDGALRYKTRLQIFLIGLFLVAVGCAAVMFNQGDVVLALALADYWMGTGIICLGYSVWVALILEIGSVAWEKRKAR